ncbi:MAG TPA: FAD-dependent monooxygenase [Archangium sp.]|nr:FAD-dependent monooxygenase [Archangium sp.]
MAGIASERPVEVAIVGAGPVGLTAANLLAMHGIKTLLFERAPLSSAYPRATNVDDEALRTFQMCGLAEQQLDGMLANPYVRVQTGSGQVVAEMQTAGVEALGFPRVCTMLQPLMEENLRVGLGRHACVELRVGHMVTSVSQTTGRASVQVQSPEGENYTVEADFVLGCDGGRSTVRKACNIPLRGANSEEKWMLIEARAEPKPEGCFRFFGALEHPMVFVQQPMGYQRWSIRLRPEDTAEQFERLDRAGLEALTGRWRDGPTLGEVSRLRTYRLNTCVAERFRADRVFLLGDSAHMMPPFAGQGLCSGLRDATNLCWKLAHVLRGRAGTRLLDSYELERIPHVEESISATRRVGWLFFPNGWQHDLVRRSVLKLLFGLPPLREQFAKHSRALPALRQGLFVGSAPAGTMFIQPRVRRADGRLVRLDEVLGSGFAALGLGVDPREAMDEESRHVWDRLGASTLKIVPAGRTPLRGTASCEEIQDVDGNLTRWFAEHRAPIALLRPDRFLAALSTQQQIPSIIRSLNRLMAA